MRKRTIGLCPNSNIGLYNMFQKLELNVDINVHKLPRIKDIELCEMAM